MLRKRQSAVFQFDYFTNNDMDNYPILYPVRPVGIGRWDCEGVVSYLCRLADLHRVAVDDLVNQCLSDYTELDFRIWRHFSFWSRSGAISVFTPYRTRVLQNALANATGVLEVQLLSLSALSSSLDFAGVSARAARHCPRCVRETAYPAAFRPLLWDIGLVTACPKHGIRLIASECGSSIGLRLSLWSRRQVPGVCTTCGGLGLLCVSIPEQRASPEEMWVAGNVGEMIAAVSAGEDFPSDLVRFGVLSMAKRIGNGCPYRAASVCGFSKARLFDWIEGRRSIKLSAFLALCAGSGSDLLSALRGQPGAFAPSTFRYPCRRRPPASPDTAERERSIRLALADPSSPSLSAVARELGIHRTTLERQFPKEARLLINRSVMARRAATAVRRDEAKRTLQKVTSDLQRSNRPVTRRNIYAESGILVVNGSRFDQIMHELDSSKDQLRQDENHEA